MIALLLPISQDPNGNYKIVGNEVKEYLTVHAQKQRYLRRCQNLLRILFLAIFSLTYSLCYFAQRHTGYYP